MSTDGVHRLLQHRNDVAESHQCSLGRQEFAAAANISISVSEPQPRQACMRYVDGRVTDCSKQWKPPMDVERYQDVLLWQGLVQTAKSLGTYQAIL